jgi:hypothetical protein
MVRALTRSRWTHMGVVLVEDGKPVVLEATSPVKRTAFDQWIARGRGGRFVVKRLRDAERLLDADARERLQTLGKSWLGKPYDLQFRWDDDTLYCSELVYKLLEQAADVKLGKIERASDMNLSDRRVQQALKRRFVDGSFDPNEPVVTPDSIFNDEKLIVVE